MGFWSLFNRHFWKLFFGLLGMIAAGLLVAYGTNFYSNYKRFSEQAKREAEARAAAEELKKLAEADIYGGKTPEETVTFFISALRKGDTDMASKYFVREKQRSWGANLQKIKEAGQLEFMMRDLEAAKKDDSFNADDASFSIFNSKKELVAKLKLILMQNGLWKISDL